MKFTVEQTENGGVYVVAEDVAFSRYFNVHQWDIVRRLFGGRLTTYEEIDCLVFYSKDSLKQYKIRDKAKLYIGKTFEIAIYRGQLVIAKALVARRPQIDDSIVVELCRNGYLDIFKSLVVGTRVDKKTKLLYFVLRNGYPKDELLFCKDRAIDLASQETHQTFVNWCESKFYG